MGGRNVVWMTWFLITASVRKNQAKIFYAVNVRRAHRSLGLLLVGGISARGVTRPARAIGFERDYSGKVLSNPSPLESRRD